MIKLNWRLSMLNEKFLNQDNNSRDKAFFAVSLMSTLWKLKELDKVDDIYLNLNRRF